MYNPIQELQAGDSIYSEHSQSEVKIESILVKRDDECVVVIQDYGIYSLEYCYSSLAYGPHWIIDPVYPNDYKSSEEFYSITDKMNEISQYD